MRWVIALLAIVAAWMAVVLYMIGTLPDGKFFGGFFLAIGAMNVLLSKTTARKFFAKAQASPPFVARVWAVAGQKGLEVLFLGIGIIFIAAGGIEIILRFL